MQKRISEKQEKAGDGERALVNLQVHANGGRKAADGIALDTFPPAAAQAVVSLFALLGWLQLTLRAICIVVLVRYRALVPLMLTLLIVEYLGRKAILTLMPIERSATSPGSLVNLAILAVMIVALVLSLWSRAAPVLHEK